MRAMSACRGALVLCALLCAMGPGCNLVDGSIRHLAKTGVQGAAEGISANDMALRKAIRDLLLKDDLLDQLTQKLTQSAMGQLTSPDQQARVQALVGAMVDTLREHGDPTLDHLLKTSGAQVEQTLQHIAADSLQRVDMELKQLLHKDIQEASELLIRRNAEILATVLTDQLNGPLGQSLQTASKQITHQVLNEATQQLRDPEAQQAMREFLRTTTREVVLGASEGLKQELHNSPTQVALIAGMIALGTLLLLMGAMLWFFVRQYMISTKVLTLVTQKINDHQGDPKELKKAISEKARHHNVENWFSDFLKRRGL